MPAPEKIAIFGGTFDPVHEGHLEIATKAVATLALNQVIFLPCRRSPHKTETPGASDAERLEMLKIATSHLPWAIVEDYELQKPPPSYTWETVRHLKQKLPPQTQLFLLIGLDQWNNLPRWQNTEALAADLEFIVVGRSGHPRPRSGFRAHFIKGNHPASASEIRKILALGGTPDWLPPEVTRFISKKDLYSATP